MGKSKKKSSDKGDRPGKHSGSAGTNKNNDPTKATQPGADKTDVTPGQKQGKAHGKKSGEKNEKATKEEGGRHSGGSGKEKGHKKSKDDANKETEKEKRKSSETPRQRHDSKQNRQSVIDGSLDLTAENIYIDRFFDLKEQDAKKKDKHKSKKHSSERPTRPAKDERQSIISETSETSSVAGKALDDDFLDTVYNKEKRGLAKTKRSKSLPNLATKPPEPTTQPETKTRPSSPDTIPDQVDSADSLDFAALDFSSDESGSTGRPDMTWIKGDGVRFSKDHGLPPEPQLADDAYSGVRRLLSYVCIFGLLPVVVYPSEENESGGKSFGCRKKKFWRKLDFYFLTLLLLIVLAICSISALDILLVDVKIANATNMAAQYSNFEKLLYQKHWLPVTIFLFTLVIALIGNLTFIFKEEEIVDFVNEVGESFQVLNFDNLVGPWWRTYGLFHVCITALDATILVTMVASKVMGFREWTQLETILYLRWFTKQAFFKDNAMIAGMCFVIILEIYVYFLARNHLLFILILAKSITQSAHGWNARIAHFLKEVASQNRKNVVHLSKILSYEILLKEHHMITKMVRSLSAAFPATILVFFGAKLMGICCQLFRAALTFLFDLKVEKVGETIKGTSVKYNPTEYEAAVECAYYLSATLVVLFVTTVTISQVGEVVMHGFSPVRRYGLLLASSLKGRKFVMSLFMSFNAKKPHVVKPGLWFYVDKGLYMSILGMALFLFSIMIQCRIVNLVEVPIILACPRNQGSICVDSISALFNKHNETFKKNLKKVDFLICNPDAKAPQHITHDTYNRCGLYCPDTRVYRMIPFKDDKNNSYLKEMVGAWDKTRMTEDCITNPYKFARKNAKFCDCFGRGPYKDTDVFNNYGFTLAQKFPSPKKVPDTVFAIDGVKCFSEEPSSPSFNPLEVCGVPFVYTQDVYNIKSAADSNPLKLRRGLEQIFYSAKLNESRSKLIKTSDCSFASDIDLRNSDLTLQYKYELMMVRLRPFSFIYNTRYEIPLDRGGKVWNGETFKDETEDEKSVRLFGHPYAYMHPKYTSESDGDVVDPKNIYSFGFSTCIGDILDYFDDCGGLDFGLENPDEQHKFDPSLTEKFCYRDATNYKRGAKDHRHSDMYHCGVLARYHKEVCDKWKGFLNPNPSNFIQ